MRHVLLFSVVFLFVAYLSGCDGQNAGSDLTNAVDLAKSTDRPGTVALERNSRNFRAHLSGGEEVPSVATRAQGQAIFQLNADGTELHYKLIVANIENILQSHIHVAPAGTNGSVVCFLYPSGPPAVLIPGRFSGVLREGTITASNLIGPLAGQPLSALLEAMESGNTYVNVHTTQNPSGEVRGQIR